MPVKETFEILSAFGYAAGALTAVGLARKAWKLWGPSKKIEPFSNPELKSLTEDNNRRFAYWKRRAEAVKLDPH